MTSLACYRNASTHCNLFLRVSHKPSGSARRPPVVAPRAACDVTPPAKTLLRFGATVVPTGGSSLRSVTVPAEAVPGEPRIDHHSSSADQSVHMDPNGSEPKVVLLFCGKRKSGKDYVTDLIQNRLGAELCCVLRLSAPLKQQYAQQHGLDLHQLLGPGLYKERYRADMICWGEARRREDPGFFCRLATRGATQPIWVVSDARRLSDLQWFRSEFPQKTLCLRVQCSESTRKQRGWSFTQGVDDAESECGLDAGVDFDWVITNDGDGASLEDQLQPVLKLATEAAST